MHIKKNKTKKYSKSRAGIKQSFKNLNKSKSREEKERTGNKEQMGQIEEKQ